MKDIVIDASFDSLTEAVQGLMFPKNVLRTLELVPVMYVSFGGEIHQGQLVLHRECVQDITYIFSELLKMKFPIEKVIPISHYDWDDERSMQDNNTSAFNYRKIIATDILSKHSFGRAIDINPKLNPYHALNGKVYPPHAEYRSEVPGTITAEGSVVTLFEERGWMWLGKRKKAPDYQHFELP